MNPISGWFHDTSRKRLETLIKDNDIKTVIEVGSFLGLSTSFFAEHCEHVYAIDPFVEWPEGKENGEARAAGKDFYIKFLMNMAERGLLGRITPLRLPSAAAAILPLKADLVYIDAAHDYHNVFSDIQHWLPHTGKILCGDDYDENWTGVVQAVDEWFGDEVKHDGNLWWVIPNRPLPA